MAAAYCLCSQPLNWNIVAAALGLKLKLEEIPLLEYGHVICKEPTVQKDPNVMSAIVARLFRLVKRRDQKSELDDSYNLTKCPDQSCENIID